MEKATDRYPNGLLRYWEEEILVGTLESKSKGHVRKAQTGGKVAHVIGVPWEQVRHN